MSNKRQEVLSNLKNMDIEQRKNLLVKNGITKEKVIHNLNNDESFKKIPLKGVVTSYLENIESENFVEFVANNLDKVPTSIIQKYLKEV